MRDVAERVENRVPLPLSIGGITAEWLTTVLGVRHPGVEVTSATIGPVLGGSATKVRVMLDYNGAGHAARLPPTMMVKGGFDEQMRARVSHAYAGETSFFQDLAGDLDINLPGCHFAGTNAATGQSILLLEDLLTRNVTFGRATRPVSVDTAAATLDLLARLHARFWESPQLQQLEWLPRSTSGEQLMDLMLSPAHWEASLGRPWGRAVPAPLRDLETVKRVCRRVWDLDRRATQTLLHGDTHLGNMFFERDGSPGYLDWQTAMSGNWAHDVTYFMVGSMETADRRVHERDLLRHYLERLAEHGGVAPDMSSAWPAYRRHVLHGFLWLLCPVDMQPEDVIAASSERGSVAAADLDLVGSVA